MKDKEPKEYSLKWSPFLTNYIPWDTWHLMDGYDESSVENVCIYSSLCKQLVWIILCFLLKKPLLYQIDSSSEIFIQKYSFSLSIDEDECKLKCAEDAVIPVDLESDRSLIFSNFR